jgi:hydroxypyruvate isomerase
MRFASHLGYLSPDLPLFRDSAEDPGPRAQIAFAAGLGLAGVQYPWAINRPPEEVAEVRSALMEFGLEAGCIVASPFDALTTPLWMKDDPASRNELFGYFRRALYLAGELGSRIVAVLIAGEGAIAQPTLVANLRSAGDLASAVGVTIGIEPMIVFPGMLLRSMADAISLIRAVDHPAVKLIFDTGHVVDMGEDVLAQFAVAFDDVCLLQFADMPGRVEPGAGDGAIDFVALTAEAARRGYDGLIELEHGWAEPGRAGETRGIALLRGIDRSAAVAVGVNS